MFKGTVDYFFRRVVHLQSYPLTICTDHQYQSFGMDSFDFFLKRWFRFVNDEKI